MMIDPSQRALLWCVLEDALDVGVAPMRACAGCEYWMERGPCARHQAGQRLWAPYLDLSGRLEAAASSAAWPLAVAEARVIARAIPEALNRRRGAAAGVDAGLRAAYTALAGSLDTGAVRR